MKVVGIIPSRYASTRFPGKPLAMIKGKTMIHRVCEQAWKSKLDAVVVATDDMRIAEEVLSFGGQYVYPKEINLLVDLISRDDTQLASLVKRFDDEEELFGPNKVKVVMDKDGKALYFSRSPIPFLRNVDKDKWLQKGVFYQHIGIYAYKAKTLREIARMQPTPLEMVESLEQLRWLENGLSIHMAVVEANNIAIDSPDDLVKAIEFAQNLPVGE